MSIKLYVGNVPTSARNAELKELFEKFGKVVECDILKEFAFVHMDTDNDAKAAIAGLNDSLWKGSRLRVELSTTKTQKGEPAKRDFNGRGGGRGGFVDRGRGRGGFSGDRGRGRGGFNGDRGRDGFNGDRGRGGFSNGDRGGFRNGFNGRGGRGRGGFNDRGDGRTMSRGGYQDRFGHRNGGGPMRERFNGNGNNVPYNRPYGGDRDGGQMGRSEPNMERGESQMGRRGGYMGRGEGHMGRREPNMGKDEGHMGRGEGFNGNVYGDMRGPVMNNGFNGSGGNEYYGGQNGHGNGFRGAVGVNAGGFGGNDAYANRPMGGQGMGSGVQGGQDYYQSQMSNGPPMNGNQPQRFNNFDNKSSDPNSFNSGPSARGRFNNNY